MTVRAGIKNVHLQTMQQLQQIKFWSNLFFLIPFALAISFNVWWYAIVIGIVFVISSVFHFNEEKKIVYVDVCSFTSLMAANFVLLFKGHLVLPYSALAFGCAAIVIFFYFRQFKHGYDFNHGLWHIFSAAVSSFCVMTFLLFMQLF